MHTHSNRFLAFALLSPVSRALFLLSVLCLVGCTKSGAKTTVSGKVTLNNQGVMGSISFIGPSGKEVQGGLLDGAYSINDVEVGENKVAVKGPPGGMAPAPGGAKDAAKLTEVPGGPTAAAKTGVPAPRKYESPDNGLKYTVTPGKQTKDFELTP